MQTAIDGIDSLVNLLILLLIGFAVFLFISLRIAKTHISAIEKPVLATYTPKTGDILLNQYRVNSPLRLPILKHYPMHASMVWIRNGEACVIEATVFNVAIMENLLECTKHQTRGIRVVRLRDFLSHCDNVAYVRRIKKELDAKALESLSQSWKDVDFEPMVADTMHAGIEITIGWRTIMPKLADLTSRWFDFEKRQTGVFCSELISRILEHLGAIRPKKDHHRIAPASYLKAIGFLEREGIEEWEDEDLIMRRL